jgi:hypothetical protein
MALKLYRRHRKGCEAGLPEDARTGEVEERRRGWKRCGCLIHASGSLGGQFNRLIAMTNASTLTQPETAMAVKV